jgi:hypothetical protein
MTKSSNASKCFGDDEATTDRANRPPTMDLVRIQLTPIEKNESILV